jgi:hypothetical protein
MTAPLLAPAALQARRRVTAIRNALAAADELLAQAFTARDWAALGHASWEAYCSAELPELRHIKLRRPERQARIAALRAADPAISVRDLAAATGASVGTVHGDLTAPAPVPAGPPLPRTDQVVGLIAAAGPAGLTCAELERRMRVHHGIASGALSRVARQGRVVHAGRARGGYGVYVVPAG